MEFIFEFIFDLLLEGSALFAKDKKMSPWIRIPCLLLVLAAGIIIIGGLGFVGIYMLIKPDDISSFYMGIFCLVVDVVLIAGAVREYRKYKEKK